MGLLIINLINLLSCNNFFILPTRILMMAITGSGHDIQLPEIAFGL